MIHTAYHVLLVISLQNVSWMQVKCVRDKSSSKALDILMLSDPHMILVSSVSNLFV